MGRAEYRDGADGFPIREAQLWTEEKLMILEAYLPAFATATKPAASRGGWHGLDLFAGGGLNWSVTRGVEIRGSALIALDAGPPAAARVALCEQDRRARQALAARTATYGERAKIVPGDANLTIGGMLADVPVRAPTFAFSDPEGADVAWSTIKALADHKRGHSKTKIEQLILFPTDMGFMRLLDRRQQNEAGAARVARIMPGEQWRDIWDARSRGDISADRARTEYLSYYAEGLKKQLGYATVLDREVPAVGRRMYFLVFATDSDAGEDIMEDCFDQVRARTADELARPRLFEDREPPRPTRL